MKIGSFLCWLFGHKCVLKSDDVSPLGPDFIRRVWTVTTFCVRCGKLKEAASGR